MVATNGQVLKEKSQEIPPKPIPLVVIPENIPEILKPLPNWVCWMYELCQEQAGRMEVDEKPYPSHEPLCSHELARHVATVRSHLRPLPKAGGLETRWHRIPPDWGHRGFGPRSLP